MVQNDPKSTPQKCQTVKKGPFFPPEKLFFLTPLRCRTKGYPLVLHALFGGFWTLFPHKYCSFWPILAPKWPPKYPPQGGSKDQYSPKWPKMAQNGQNIAQNAPQIPPLGGGYIPLNVLTAILNPLLEGPFLRMTVFLTLEYCTFWGKKDDNVFCSVYKKQNELHTILSSVLTKSDRRCSF